MNQRDLDERDYKAYGLYLCTDEVRRFLSDSEIPFFWSAWPSG